MKKNSRSLGGWTCRSASGYRDITRLMNSIPFCVRSGSLSGSESNQPLPMFVDVSQTSSLTIDLLQKTQHPREQRS